MKTIAKKLNNIYSKIASDQMRQNSMMLITSQIILGGSLFIFFAINAHLQTTVTVGLVSSFLSLGLLVTTFTHLGLPNTILRYLVSSSAPYRFLIRSFFIVAITSSLGAWVTLIFIGHLIPKLLFISHSRVLSLLFVLLVSGTALTALLDATLVAMSNTKFVLVRSIIVNLPRLFLPFVVVTAAFEGLIAVYVITLISGLIINLIIVIRKLVKIKSEIKDFKFINQYRKYAASNYLGGLFGILPASLVPIIILNNLGPVVAAYYYIPTQVALFLSVICNSISQSFISEASKTDDPQRHKKIFQDVFRHQYKLLVPIIGFLSIISWPILRLYGSSYAEKGLAPLLILTAASLFVGLNWLGDTWLNVKKRNRDYFLMNTFNSLIVVILVYYLSSYGLTAAAVGWFIGQTISAIIYLIIFKNDKLLVDITARLKTSKVLSSPQSIK